MSIQAVNESLYGWLVEMTKIGGCLPRLMAHHECLRIDQSESINDDFPFDRLYRIDNNSHGARCELLEGLLRVDIDGREPAAEARMRMVPTHDGLGS